MKDYQKWVEEGFRKQFGEPEFMVRAPGRINLIGEHTDYNSGWVFPASIRQSIYFAFRKNKKPYFQIEALDLGEAAQISLEGESDDERTWVKFLAGMIREFGDAHMLTSCFDVTFGGDLPIGAGLSSSAALACGLGWGLHKGAGATLSLMEIARMAWYTENTHMGVNCGFMDQYSVCFGMEGMALHLDCRTLKAEYVPLNLGDYSLVLFDSGVKHQLADSGYNDRRQLCEEVVNSFRSKDFPVDSLRDLKQSDLEIARGWLSEDGYTAARYVLQENERVQLFRKAMTAGELERLGALMTATHWGLSKDFKVSCPEIDFLVEQANALDGISGSRMMGGGFGGCTLNLIEKDQVETVFEKIASAYKKRFNIELKCIPVETGNGVEVV